MKKLFTSILLVGLIAAALVVPAFAKEAATPALPAHSVQLAQQDEQPAPLELPDALQGLIAMGIGFLVTQGLKALFVKSGVDLSGVAAAITAGFVTSVVAFGNFLLSLVPSAYVEPVSIALMLIVSVFGVFGLHYSYAAMKTKK